MPTKESRGLFVGALPQVEEKRQGERDADDENGDQGLPVARNTGPGILKAHEEQQCHRGDQNVHAEKVAEREDEGEGCAEGIQSTSGHCSPLNGQSIPMLWSDRTDSLGQGSSSSLGRSCKQPVHQRPQL